jgi:uncharacterized protein YndB with AHSA1/START domain
VTITFLVILFVLLAALGLYILIKTPKVMKITRSIKVLAAPQSVFPYINNPKLIQEWNSFTKGDSTLTLGYEGPDEGNDAKWNWRGKKAGIGRATIVASETNSKVGLRLEFEKPFKVTNYGEYVLVPIDGQTEVTWTINETALIPRVLSNFINLDRIIGGVFENGLAMLKNLAETKK